MDTKKILKTLFGIAEYIHDLWKKIPKTEILNQETTINVPESFVEYSIAIRIPNNLRSIRKTIPITIPSIIRASVSSLYPMPRTISGAIKRSLDSSGYVVFPELIPSNTEIISLSVTYPIEDILVLRDFVETNRAHDPSGDDRNEYWFHALLKHPRILHDSFGRFDVRDIDVTVDVSIQQELQLSIPRSFIFRLKTFFELFAETDPRQQWRAIPKLRTLSSQRTAGREMDILNDLQGLFLPRKFSRFIDVTKDFRYSSCYHGSDCYELPIELIPTTMEIVSRTDLSLERPAAEGVLIYRRNLFLDALSEIF